MTHPVDLVVNCFERTYRQVLAPGFFPQLVAQNDRPLRCVALVNNVEDRAHVETLARDLQKSGEIDEYAFVEDHLEAALSRTGLRLQDLGRVPHYSDCALVAATLEGAPWLLYWDADVRLGQPTNWVDAALECLESDPRVFVASPRWPGCPDDRPGPGDPAADPREQFRLDYGFSDQVFLARRAELAAPIYRHFAPASWRYPMAHIAMIFEARVDAYMRRHRRLRATYLAATYRHLAHQRRQPEPRSLRERARRFRNRWVCYWLRGLRLPDPRLRLD